METLTRIFFIMLAIFSVGYCAAVRINETREQRRMPPAKAGRPQKISRLDLIKAWTISIF